MEYHPIGVMTRVLEDPHKAVKLVPEVDMIGNKKMLEESREKVLSPE